MEQADLGKSIRELQSIRVCNGRKRSYTLLDPIAVWKPALAEVLSHIVGTTCRSRF